MYIDQGEIWRGLIHRWSSLTPNLTLIGMGYVSIGAPKLANLIKIAVFSGFSSRSS